MRSRGTGPAGGTVAYAAPPTDGLLCTCSAAALHLLCTCSAPAPHLLCSSRDLLTPRRLPEGKIASLIDLPAAFESQVSLIEWPERLGDQLVTPSTPGRLEVTLGGIGPQACGRAVTLRAVGARWQQQLSEWGAGGPPPPPHRPDARSSSADGAKPAPPKPASAGPALRPAGDPRDWLVLGIESSCDDTGAAVVRGDGAVLGEVLASQAGVHGMPHTRGSNPRLAGTRQVT